VSPSRTLPLVSALLLASACSHSVFETSANQLKTDSEDFQKSLRFQDYGGAAQLVVPTKRQAFLAARRKEANDLTITDVEVLDVQMAPDAMHAVVTSRMRWVKLPSPSELTADIHESWVFNGTAWLVVTVAGGPFPELEP
jgi:hypothetical protein